IPALIGLSTPIRLIGLGAVHVGQAAGLPWHPATIGIVVLAGGFLVSRLLFVMAMLSVPSAVFFQAYALYFLGSRYPQLGEKLTFPALGPPSPGTLPPTAAPVPAS